MVQISVKIKNRSSRSRSTEQKSDKKYTRTHVGIPKPLDLDLPTCRNSYLEVDACRSRTGAGIYYGAGRYPSWRYMYNVSLLAAAVLHTSKQKNIFFVVRTRTQNVRTKDEV